MNTATTLPDLESTHPFREVRLTWGTKRWASTQKICTLASQHKLFPGNPGHYWDDPGGDGEEYAITQTTSGSPWQYASMLTPDVRSNSAVLSDVNDPWTGATVTNFAGRIKSGHRATVQFDTLPLDGSLRMKLTGPSGADFDLLLYSARAAADLTQAGKPARRWPSRFADSGA